jgi:Fe-S-cluster containining protein
MDEIIRRWQSNASRQQSKTLQLLKKLPRKEAGAADKLAAQLHEEVFEKIDCLCCANCCKTISPILKARDIERIASYLGIRQGELMSRYLILDSDNDYVMNAQPCPFLDKDNHCRIYEVRPRACREYPHTDAGQLLQKATMHARNSVACPAVYEILERLKAQLR